MTARMDARFAKVKEEGRPALVTFVMSGDPDYDTSLAILKRLPSAGADVVELGMPFSDPMADGPAIQAGGLRALKAGQTLHRTLDMVKTFREEDADTPIVLMGYYNPIYIYGVAEFLEDARNAGVDGLIVVDLPPEEDAELCVPTVCVQPILRDSVSRFLRMRTVCGTIRRPYNTLNLILRSAFVRVSKDGLQVRCRRYIILNRNDPIAN